MSIDAVSSVSRETLPFLRAEGLTKHYGSEIVLRDLSLDLDAGDLVALLGPSGSGKSTLLRCIAGLITPDEGHVLLDGRNITALPAHERGFGMMFQQLALFPHRTVAQNVAFGLRMQRWPAREREARVEEMLALVGLQGFGQRSIFELSGGEQQRVALARSLAPKPKLLMLDEPLGALDRGLRERLVLELRHILRDLGLTALYVTHDQEEAYAIGDRLVLLDRGVKVQEGAPEAVYRQPASRFAAAFFGLTNQVPVWSATPMDDGRWRVESDLGRLEGISGTPSGTLLLRPEGARLEGTVNGVRGTLVERLFRGSHYRLTVRYGEHVLTWELSELSPSLPEDGEPITLYLRPGALTFIPD